MKAIRFFAPVGIALAAGGLMASIAMADSEQTASNTAVSSQNVAAVSGDAYAEGKKSFASTGAATSVSLAAQLQSIQQRVGSLNADDSQNQDATNEAGLEQVGVSGSGNAEAADGATSETGAADSIQAEVQAQEVVQDSAAANDADEEGEDNGEEENGEGDEG